jgi:nucleotide-binding universal stress UspA family protein
MLADPLRKILVPVDFGPASAQAIALGGFFASASGARLMAVHAETFEVPPYFTLQQIARYEAERKAARVQALSYLRGFIAEHTEWEAEAHVVEERPSEAIIAAAGDADLVIMGTHGRRGPGRWWRGSVAERVVRASPCPVLVLHEGVQLPAPMDLFARVVVAGAGGEASALALDQVRALVAHYQGAVIVESALDACAPAALERASLIVLILPADAGRRLAPDPGAVLKTCQRPVLFIRTS